MRDESKPPWEDFLERETDVGYFLRGHLAIHNHLSTLITLHLNPALLTHTSFNLLQTFEIAVAIGIMPDKMRPLIRRINVIRNGLAHKIGLDLDMDTAMSLYAAADLSDVPVEDCINEPLAPKAIVSYVFRFSLYVIDKRIANTLARREKTRRALLGTSPKVNAAFDSWWKSETDPENPEVLALEKLAYKAMSNMTFPLPPKLGFPD